MKKIYYLQKHEVKLGDTIEYNGIKAIVTEEIIELNPELFVVEDSMQELLNKAKRDYPIGTMFNSKYGIQKVIGDTPIVGVVIPGTVQISTDVFPGGATIYTPEDGWYEILPLKFITEDGVNIYGDMKTYAICREELNLELPSVYGGNSPTLIYFYYKENALAYIEKHKGKTLEDYEKILLDNKTAFTFATERAYFSVWGWIKDEEPKLYYTKILQLIADDLNDGWVADFSKGGTKWYISEEGFELTRLCNHGAVHFKTKELAKKARLILGDNVKYLFN